MDALVKKPDILSFSIASKIPVSESTRQELLDIDGIAYRLRREIELLERIDLIQCKICRVIIVTPILIIIVFF
jgi:cereblon